MEAGGRPRDRQPVPARGARGDEAAAVDGRDPCRGATDHGHAEERGRPRGERPVVVEERRDQQPRPRGHLGHRRVTGGRLDRAGAAGVPELQVGELPDRPGDLAAAGLQLGQRRRLEAPDDQRPRALARDGVGNPGDLALVGHQPDEVEPATFDDGPGEGDHRVRVVHGGPLGPDVLAADEQPGVDVDRDPDRAVRGPGRVDDVEVRRVVDHEGDRPQRLGGAGELGQRRPVHRRVGHEDVPGHALALQPQGLGQGVGQDAPEAVVVEGSSEQVRDPHRLGGHADRLARRASYEVVGVGVESVEVHHRDRAAGARGRGGESVVQPRRQGVAVGIGGHPALGIR